MYSLYVKTHTGRTFQVKLKEGKLQLDANVNYKNVFDSIAIQI